MPGLLIPDNSDYDISRAEDEILESLRYMIRGNEYELVLQLRNAKSLVSMIPEPSLDLPEIAGPPAANIFTDEVYEAGMGLGYIYSLVSDPDIAEKIIKNIRCRPSLKNVLLEQIGNEPDGLDSSIKALMHINLKNYLGSTKDAIDKLIFLQHIKKDKIFNTAHNKIKPVELVTALHGIAVMDYRQFYNRYLDEEFLKAFAAKLTNSINDKRINLLADSLDCIDWDRNIEKIRHSLNYGNEYIRIMSEKRKSKNNIVHGRGSLQFSVAKLKVVEAFAKEYIPANVHDLKVLNRIMMNYLKPSAWRSRIVFSVRRAGRGVFNVNFVPCKDYSMVLRHLAGSDCSSDFFTHLLNDASSFYKIMFFNDWIGYITLLRVKTETGVESVLVDVININSVMVSQGFTIDSIFDDMVERLSSALSKTGLRYLLIPVFSPLLSNSDCDSIYHKFKGLPRVDGPLLLYCKADNDYRLKEDSYFQSMECDKYIIVRDFTEHGQGVLKGCE